MPLELGSLADELQRVANEHQDEIAGVALCSEYDGIAVFLAGPTDATRDELTAITERYGNWRVIFNDVAAPLSVSLRVIDAVMRDERISGLISAGPDIYSGGITFGILEEEWTRRAEIAAYVDEIARSVEPEIRIPVSFTAEADGIDLLAPRLLPREGSFPPFPMRGTLHHHQSRMLLTHGHCTGGAFYHNRNCMGTQLLPRLM